MQDDARTVLVIEVENGGLHINIGGSEGGGMAGKALDLGGTAVKGGDQHSCRIKPQRHGGCKGHRNARNALFDTLDVWEDLLDGFPAGRKAGQGE